GGGARGSSRTASWCLPGGTTTSKLLVCIALTSVPSMSTARTLSRSGVATADPLGACAHTVTRTGEVTWSTAAGLAREMVYPGEVGVVMVMAIIVPRPAKEA